MIVKQGMWIINKQRCKKCRICANFYSAGSLLINHDGFPIQSEEVKCRQCGLCERWCPDFAIEVGDINGAK